MKKLIIFFAFVLCSSSYASKLIRVGDTLRCVKANGASFECGQPTVSCNSQAGTCSVNGELGVLKTSKTR